MSLLTRHPPLPLHFEPFEGTLEEWGEILETFPDREIFQTPAWIRFLAESQHATPVIAVLKDRHETAGYFAGLTVRKFGLKILGSPFIGWTTDRMGLRLLPDVPRRPALGALLRYAFRDLGCVHLEVADANLTAADALDLNFHTSVMRSSLVDLSLSEDQLLRNMSSKSARYAIRKASKVGVVVEEARDDAFAHDYYQQLCDVFAKQSLVPTYGVDRVQSLIRHLLPTGNLQLLRARAPDGRCIATGIFLGFNQCVYFWGNASWRPDQHFSPNELLHWHAMRHWKQRGMRCYDFCGGGAYKRKYGGQPIERLYFRRSRHWLIAWGRDIAATSFLIRQRIAGRKKGAPAEDADE